MKMFAQTAGQAIQVTSGRRYVADDDRIIDDVDALDAGELQRAGCRPYTVPPLTPPIDPPEPVKGKPAPSAPAAVAAAGEPAKSPNG
jgi:hypothetical protein